MLTRFVRIQLIIFTTISLLGVSLIAFKYVQVQSFLGVGRTTIKLELPAGGGLYRFSNVTYRGVQVGQVTSVDVVRKDGKDSVQATLSLETDEKIPADLEANVRSVSAVGEQYVDLVPRSGNPPYLTDGSVIAMADTSLPQPVGPLLDKASTFIGSFPKNQLHNMLNELYSGFNGADYDFGSLFDSAAKIAHDANGIADRTKSLIDDTQPLLDTQVQSSDAIRVWTRSLAGFTEQLKSNDPELRSLLEKGPPAINEASRLLNELNPTIPVLLANLTTFGQLAVTYHPGLEQILVLLPPVVSIVEAVNPNRNAQGLGLGSFRITVSDPPACTVGFLPPNMWRPPYDTTTIDTPDGIYCKLPQDSPIAVRGTRNIPCMNNPDKRAPTAEICKSDQDFEPLAQKQPVLGPYPRDPGLEAQGVPKDSRWFPDQGLYSVPGQGPSAPDTHPTAPPTTALMPPPAGGEESPSPPPLLPSPPPDTPAVRPPSAPPSVNDPAVVAPPPVLSNDPAGYQAGHKQIPAVAYARYDPTTGQYFGPDGRLYRETELADAGKTPEWKDMVLAPWV